MDNVITNSDKQGYERDLAKASGAGAKRKAKFD